MTEGSIQIIRAETARFYNISLADIEGPSKKRRNTHPRQMAMLLCRKMTEKSYPEIARYFGGRAHTTVMHGVSVMRDLVRRDMDVRQQFDRLRLRVSCRLDARDATLLGVEA